MQYLFYHLYRVASSIREGGDPEQRALFFLTMLQMINFYSIYQLILSLVLNNKYKISITIIIVVVIAAFTINYFLYLSKDKYRNIFVRFNEKSKIWNLVGMIVLSVYIILSIIIVFYAKHLQPS